MKLTSRMLLLPLVVLLASSSALALNPGEGGVAPDIAAADLKAGNARFSSGAPTHAAQDERARKALAGGQHPEAVILSCSDSRVPPELVFDQGLGRLFTVRVAGNVAEPATVASIEYGVEHLGARLIVVMGHESCGAVKAALETPKGASAGSSDLDTLIGEVRTNLGPSVKTGVMPDESTMEKAVELNALTVARGLTKRSKILREAVTAHRVEIRPAVYHLSTGQVEFLDAAN